MNKLILVEGIPGSGKTTLSGKIAGYLNKHVKTKLYNEGEAHPADLAWCACIPVESYEGILEKFPAYEKAIRDNTHMEDGYAIVAYIQFPIEDKQLYELLESYEVYDGRASYGVFSGLHLRRWRQFAEKAAGLNEITVFECAYLQNQINELLLFHDRSEKSIREHMLSLIDTVKDLTPVLFYLAQPDIYETINRVAVQRVDEHGNKAWMERVISYLENCPYGRSKGLKGFDGMVKAFEDRKQIELAVISELPIKTYVIHNHHYDWEAVWADIEEKLPGLLV